MKTYSFIFSLVILLFLSACKSKKTYQLVWSDEFEISGKPDSTKWSYEYGFLRNNEEQFYTDNPKNIRVENGALIIETHLEKIINPKFKTNEFDKKHWLKWIAKRDSAKYTSASITTIDLAEWTYGKFEIKAKLPTGIGLWPAIWMLGENKTVVNWPECGEIDIMEYVGYEKDSIFGTIHTKAYNHMIHTQKGKKTFINNPDVMFHLFALEWTPEKIDFLLDGKIYNHIENEHKTTDEWPFDQNFHLKLNVAVGGALGGKKGIDDTVFPKQMIIDYIRVYQKKVNN